MKEIDFKVGDVVVAKCGGPKMTIKGIGDYSPYTNAVLCMWFDGTKLKEDVFVPETIKLSFVPEVEGCK